MGIYDKSWWVWINRIALRGNAEIVTYFDSFGVKHTPKEIRKFIGNKNFVTNISRIEAYDSIMCEQFFIGFIEFMLKSKSLLEYTNSFPPNEYKKNGKIKINSAESK